MILRSALIALFCSVAVHAAQGDALPRSLAITDPPALRELDRSLGVGAMLAASVELSPDNAELFALPAMAPVRKSLDAEFVRYVASHRARSPRETIGVGAAHDVQLFDQHALYGHDTRFVLAGVVNRMDRGYVAPDTCGEIRLIYRLIRTGEAAARLPMTLNVVLRARPTGDPPIGCADLAGRWLAASDAPEAGASLAAALLAPGGALASIRREHLDRIETNLQIAHAPKSSSRDFRTDYLQKVFRYDTASGAFVESPLENQLDRDRLLEDTALARDLRSWLLDPVHLGELDRGTVLIPDKFLAVRSLATTPAFGEPDRQPQSGLMQSDHAGGKAVFRDAEVVAALAAAAANGVALQNIRSPAGFAGRLNDIGCGGCHQVRGIGGFHFPGADAMAQASSTVTAVPASPHFVGDQPRRREIAAAIRDGVLPDYSRGFSDRPQSRSSASLAGTEYLDGWGATCYRAPASGQDSSFASWRCAEGLACQAAGADKVSRIGMCFVK